MIVERLVKDRIVTFIYFQFHVSSFLLSFIFLRYRMTSASCSHHGYRGL